MVFGEGAASKYIAIILLILLFVSISVAVFDVRLDTQLDKTDAVFLGLAFVILLFLGMYIRGLSIRVPSLGFG